MKGKRWGALVVCLCMMMSMSFPASAAGNSAAKLLKNMTLEQKIGQMIMPAFQYWTDEEGTSRKVTTLYEPIAQAIREYGFGGVILFGENTAGTTATTELICDMQSAALSSDTGIPLLMSVDQEGGYVYRLGTGTDTCGNMALGAANDPALCQKAASIIGSELEAEGFQIDFAPVMDINNNPNNPVIGVRSFSDDAQCTAELGSAFISGLHSQNIAAALKHFPGHGDTATDSHSGLPSINKSLSELESCELVPFAAGIKAGADVIMTAHIQYPQIETSTYTSIATGEEITLPATLSKTFITDLLRNKMGYTGLVSTDAMNMSAIAKHFDRLDAARLAINAGVDILLMPVNMPNQAGIDDCGVYIAGIADMVRNGSISEDTIDAAVTRILQFKIDRGLFEQTVNKETQVRKALSVVGSKENHDTEWAITEKTITMVKNHHMLPIRVSDGGKVVLFASYSNEVTAMKYAIARMKDEGVIPESADCQVFCYQKMTSVSEEFAQAVKDADAVVASVETTGISGMNPDAAGGWQSAFLDELMDLTHENGKKIAIISIQLPYDLARYQKADALLAAYNCKGMNVTPTVFQDETTAYGPNLPAAVCAVFGAFTPSAKLPVDVPELDEQYGYTRDILYPRGYGLSNWNAGSFFIDVLPESYYAEAVDWGVENEVTMGTSKLEFGPDEVCTRAQVVTFLWHCAGGPESSWEGNFQDVPTDSYYATAVRWAAEAGITAGTSDKTFSPDDICTRAQIVTFLWHYAGCPAETAQVAFRDVPNGAYYETAVYWAAKAGITAGTSKQTFSPNQTCTRAQAITFLWRAMQEN